jgi:predicted small lipoprotein YifL
MDDETMKQVLRTLAIFFLLLATVSLAGCGKKGALIPPEALVPAAVIESQVTQRGDVFRVSWTAPTREESGRPLKGGVRFRIYRREVLLPGQDCTACPDVWKLLGEIDSTGARGLERSGSRFTYSDHELVPDKTYQYRIQVVDPSGGLSRAILLPPRQRLTPPFPPVLQAAPGSAGVHLEFVAPTLPERETGVGYLLFRQHGATVPVQQLTTNPVTAVTYDDRDVQLGETYRYTARTLATIAGQAVESADSNEAVITIILPE